MQELSEALTCSHACMFNRTHQLLLSIRLLCNSTWPLHKASSLYTACISQSMWNECWNIILTVKKSNATYLSTLKSCKYRLKQCGYPLANIPMEGWDLVSPGFPLRRRVACLSEPLYKHAAREKLCSPAAPLGYASIYSERAAVIRPSRRSASLNGRVLQPQSSGIYENEW